MVVTLPVEYTWKKVDKETLYPFLPELCVLGEENTEL